MKASTLFTAFSILILAACSKPNDETAASPVTTTGSTGTGGSGTSGAGTGGGGTGSGGSTPPAYIVKTWGIDGMAIVANTGHRLMSFSAGSGFGTSIELDNTGTGLTVEIANANTEPSIINYGGGSGYSARYPNIKHTFPNVLSADDTLTYLTFKIKGFNPAADGFNQLNLVVCDEGNSYNGNILVANITSATQSMLTNAYLHEVFDHAPQKKLQVILGP